MSEQPPRYGPPSYGTSPQETFPYGTHGPAKPWSQMRTAAADRDRAIEVLSTAYGEGRLTKEEFDERSEQALAARTYADLSSLLEDLPGGVPAAPPSQRGYYPPVRPTSGLAVASLVCAMTMFLAVPSVILGHIARARIRQTGERGDGMAIAGLVLGYLQIIFWVLLGLGVVAVSHTYPVPGSPG